MDFIEQPSSASLRRRTCPLPVGVNHFALIVEIIKRSQDDLAALYEPVATETPSLVSVKAHNDTSPKNRVSGQR
jgi:hypothetical protein